MKAQTLTFAAPFRVEIREQDLPGPATGQVLVQTTLSAISPGTEMLVYRGQCPQGLADPKDSLSSNIQYPLAYGYACVGQVVELGKGVDPGWLGCSVFSFQPHTSHFLSRPEALIPLPQGIAPEDACFFPNMETAVNLVQDSAPILGEKTLVLGQGIIGLLTTALLAQFPLEKLVSADKYARRRENSLAAGAHAALNPDTEEFLEAAKTILAPGADLTLELSGAPSALDSAIALTRFSGRIVIGSWYGEKRAPIDLGGVFHRSRLKLVSSQVSTIAPELSGRWDKARRYETTWAALAHIQPGKWISQRFNLQGGAQAYQLLDQAPETAIQIVFEY
jgi:2-desacetyl-2-hydroxyethyl bacteriochlorophyllide A dehydrogenase